MSVDLSGRPGFRLVTKQSPFGVSTAMTLPSDKQHYSNYVGFTNELRMTEQ